MYQWFSQFSAWLSDPFGNAAYSSNIALLAVVFFGFVGAVAPCQISANIGAITFFGKKQLQARLLWSELAFYVSGKVIVYSVFGLLFWLFGRGISNESISLFVIARKLQGPLFVAMGLTLIGWIRFAGVGFRLSNFVSTVSKRIGGRGGALLMGIAFSLGFCPTMFTLFFGGVMPLAMKSSYGIVLPPVFAVATAMPLLLFTALTVGFGLDTWMIKRVQTFGRGVQIAAGLIFIVLGISDTFTYWSL